MDVCPHSDLQLWKGQCYSFHHDEHLNWATARERCLAKSVEKATVDLLSIHSDEEKNYVYSQLQNSEDGYWIGYYKGANGMMKHNL